MTRGHGEVQCKFCRTWQWSAFQHADEESFMATAPWAEVSQECVNPSCRQTIEPDVHNVRWRSD